ncbi:MAG TPA: M20 aminoacylase family protein [Acetobacteraceae bacterium]|jgi:hippurate hydrolase|nr:M20 aminoacylase family protein [Acetobacteraceae bacterium]
MTSPIDQIRPYHAELTAIRRDIHANPELGLEEHRTAELVARKLEEWGIEVHRGVGKTGVVGVLRSGNGEATIGLRADMDALPIVEANDFAYRSQNTGTMHACGHDGHTTMLLGAARYLAETRKFNGTVNFIFQPGEEGIGGALEMLKDGLFQRFPCNAVYGMHNRPGMPVGKYGIAPGTAMAGGGFFDITITGKGAHGARPEDSIDPVLVACHVGTALQSIVSRNLSPRETAVLSVTRIQSGDAYNVIPQSAMLAGTVRAMRRETLEAVEQNMRRIVAGVATGFGAAAEVDFRLIFAPLVNHPEHTQAIADAAADLVGDNNVNRAQAPAVASEDFAFMLEQVPGAYINVGNGDSAAVHNHLYNFNDEAIPFGSALWARLVERQLPRGSE